jgi:tRNA (cmo5U34)-methyltransferase
MSEEQRFSFSSVANGFDEHITKSIRGYADLRDDVVGISRYFILDETNVLDIGCSQGTMLKRIKDENTQAPNANYTGIEINKDFQQHWKPETNLNYKVEDVRESDALSNMSFAISLFTFQFLAEKDRLSLLQKIYDNLVDGGAFVTAEKIYSMNAKVQDMVDSLYYDFKRQSFTEKEILDKEQELRHLAKLTTENLLISQLRSVGFRGIQIFWRNFNFIGVLAMKRPPEGVGDE